MRRAKHRGMTLIEVLVAFVVLSVTMAVILQIFSGGMRNARLAEGYNRALFLAQSQMASVGQEQKLAVGESSGSVGDGLHWRVTIDGYDDEGAVERYALTQRLYQVRVRVDWNSGDGQQRQVQLVSLRLGPVK